MLSVQLHVFINFSYVFLNERKKNNPSYMYINQNLIFAGKKNQDIFSILISENLYKNSTISNFANILTIF